MVDGIAVISDGAENALPFLGDVYRRYTAFVDKPVPVYWYHVQGDIRRMLRQVAQTQYHRDPTEYEYRGAEGQRDRDVGHSKVSKSLFCVKL